MILKIMREKEKNGAEAYTFHTSYENKKSCHITEH